MQSRIRGTCVESANRCSNSSWGIDKSIALTTVDAFWSSRNRGPRRRCSTRRDLASGAKASPTSRSTVRQAGSSQMSLQQRVAALIEVPRTVRQFGCECSDQAQLYRCVVAPFDNDEPRGRCGAIIHIGIPMPYHLILRMLRGQAHDTNGSQTMGSFTCDVIDSGAD
eukprot:11173739-Lingulodinium_polyedra.AAC.1